MYSSIPPRGGGVDGGSWVHCNEEKQGSSYTCTVYWDSDGALRAKGNYVLRQVTWDKDKGRAIYFEVEGEPELNFDFFDGILIHLHGELALVPNGIIDLPFGDGHGKKQHYEMGRPQGPEEEY